MVNSFYVNDQALITIFEAALMPRDYKSATNSQGCHCSRQEKKANDHEHMIQCGIILSLYGIAAHTLKKVDSGIVFEEDQVSYTHDMLSTNA